MSGTRSPFPRVRATDDRAAALVLATHGIGGHAGVAERHAAAIERLNSYRSVKVGCVKGEPTIEEALGEAGRPVRVVPLLLADGFIMAKLRADLEGRSGVEIAPPLGLHPDIPVLARRLAIQACADQGWFLSDATLLLVGHGTPQHPMSAATTEAAAGHVRATRLFRSVRTAYLDQGSFLTDVAGGLDGGACVAVGMFMDEGPHGQDDVLEGLAEAKVPVAYAGPIGSNDGVQPLILDLARGSTGAEQGALERGAA